MLLIPCPNCGDRSEAEFSYGGRAVKFPALDNQSTIKNWHEVVHMRDNPAGNILELWYHQAGCECWIQVKRNVLTHEINDVSVNPLAGVTR
jgi:heterotetrameric sarcosine oxidase delta subunit